MTRTPNSENTEMLRQDCARCGAKAGEWCRSRTGRRAHMHVLRWYAALRARGAV